MRNLILGDAYQEIPKLEDGSIDVVITDPPYGIDYQDWDKNQAWSNLAELFHQKLKPTGQVAIFAGWSRVAEVKAAFEEFFTLKNWIVWDRIKGRGAKTNFTSTREDILWFVKDPKNYVFNKTYSNIPKKTKGMGAKNGQKNRSLSNVWYDISPIVPWSKERLKHPTQKPLALIARMVRIFSNPGDLVLDPFGGSGTTAEACLNEDRDYILMENNPTYHQIIKDRTSL